MRNAVRAGVLASALTLAFNNVARAEPEIAIRDAVQADLQNSREIKKAAKEDPGTDTAAKTIAAELAKKTVGIKPSHPVVMFFKVLIKSKPAY